MGGYLSVEERREEERKQQEMVYNEALRKYNIRIQAYHRNANIQMPYWRYEKICRAQFELDLLPDHVKYGPNYSGDY